MSRAVLVLLIFGVLSLSPLVNNGLFTSADGEAHLVRLAYFSQNLFRGELFPGWVNELNKGLGYPIFVFTYPLPYYIGSLWMLFGLGVVNSIKVLAAVSIVCGSWFYYLWMRRVVSSRWAYLAAVVFLFTPYKFVDLFVRFALGELVFLMVLPMAFWFLESGKYKLFGLAVTLLVLSHLQMSVLFLPIIFGYAWIRGEGIKNVALIIGLGISGAAFFWLPAKVLLSSTTFDTVNQFPPIEHLATGKQIIYMPWGFGFSRPGLADDMSFQLGMVNWLGMILSTLLFFRLSLAWKWMMAISWVAIILIVSSPFGFWELEITQFVQFPWRLLAVTTFLTPAMLVVSLSKVKVMNSIWMVVCVILLSIYTNRNHIRINQPAFVESSDRDFFRLDTTTTSTPAEFMPRPDISEPKKLFTKHWVFPLSKAISVAGLFGILMFRNPSRKVGG